MKNNPTPSFCSESDTPEADLDSKILPTCLLPFVDRTLYEAVVTRILWMEFKNELWLLIVPLLMCVVFTTTLILPFFLQWERNTFTSFGPSNSHFLAFFAVKRSVAACHGSCYYYSIENIVSDSPASNCFGSKLFYL